MANTGTKVVFLIFSVGVTKMDLLHIPLVLLIGTIAGFINTLAGGGSLLTLPFLIFMGLPPSVANGTNRVAIFIQCGNAIYAFRKKGISNFKFTITLAIAALIGAFFGARIAIDINEQLFNKILAAIMLLVLAFILFKPTQKNHDLTPSPSRSLAPSLPRSPAPSPSKYILQIIIFFLIGIYGGFIQAGVGFLIIFALSFLTNFDLIRINAIKVFVVFVYTIIALGTFILNDKINWPIGLTLAVGTSLGAWLAAHYGVKMGEKWLKGVLTITVITFAIKLLLG